MPSHPVTRRGFLVGTGGLAATLLAGCGSDTGSDKSSGNAWQFTDDRGIKITRDQRPARVVAYVSSAAALWDYGVRPIGAFGPQKTESGEKEIQAGNIDLSKVESVGNAWDDFDEEKFIGLNADLVITGWTGTDKNDVWVLQDEVGKKVEKHAPILALSEYKVALPKVIERYADLAKALGADLNAEAVKSAKDEFDSASDELAAAAKAKPGLKVLVVYGEKAGLSVAKPEYFADLSYYKELGLDIVAGEGDDEYWEALSWEQAGKYPADLILTDARTFAMTREQMAEFPTWKALPAVSAGQLGDWSAEPRFNYELAAPVIRELTKAVTNARTDIAS